MAETHPEWPLVLQQGTAAQRAGYHASVIDALFDQPWDGHSNRREWRALATDAQGTLHLLYIIQFDGAEPNRPARIIGRRLAVGSATAEVHNWGDSEMDGLDAVMFLRLDTVMEPVAWTARSVQATPTEGHNGGGKAPRLYVARQNPRDGRWNT